MRSIMGFRQHRACVFASGVWLVIASMLLAPIAAAATPSQAGVSWDYLLLGKLNSAWDPVTEQTVVITGGGSFDVSQRTITGGGGYTIFDTGGSVVGSGTWVAKTFDGFTPTTPGQSPGEGGHLELEADFAGALSGPAHVVIQCSMWGETVGPPGYPWPSDFVEAGPYTEPKTGAVMFHLNQ